MGGGIGLLAGCDIPSGTVVGEYKGESIYRLFIPHTKKYVVWKMGIDGKPEFIFQDPYAVWIYDSEAPKRSDGSVLQMGVNADFGESEEAKCKLRRINHSAQNNVQLVITSDNRIFAIASHPISKNDELFWDYDPERQGLFQLKEGEQHLLKSQDHIEREPLEYVDIDSEGFLTVKSAFQRSKGKRHTIWK